MKRKKARKRKTERIGGDKERKRRKMEKNENKRTRKTIKTEGRELNKKK